MAPSNTLYHRLLFTSNIRQISFHPQSRHFTTSLMRNDAPEEKPDYTWIQASELEILKRVAQHEILKPNVVKALDARLRAMEQSAKPEDAARIREAQQRIVKLQAHHKMLKAYMDEHIDGAEKALSRNRALFRADGERVSSDKR